MTETTDFREHLHRLESLLQELEAMGDPAVQDKARDIVQTLLEFHGAAVARILDHLEEAGEAGQEIAGRMMEDEAVSSLLLLHGLHPLDLEARVRGALDKVRPYLHSHGGEVELVAVRPDASIHLRLEGSCHGCPSSRETMKNAIEEAIYAAAPEVARIQVDGLPEEPAPEVLPAGFVSVSQLTVHRAPAHAGAD